MLIPRIAASTLRRLDEGFPVVEVTGPRQSGKTTLVRELFADKPYASLENPDLLEFALSDPRGFLAQYPICCRVSPRAWPVAPSMWYASYVQTYIERDVRQLVNVRDLTQFQRFLRQCAGRSGQLVNLSTLGDDAGVSHNTAREWISVLEASYLTFWRDRSGHEVDLIVDRAGRLQPVEIKAGATIGEDGLRRIKRWLAIAGARRDLG